MSAVTSRMPDDATFQQRLAARQARGGRWQAIFLSAILAGLLMLIILLFSIINQAFGLIAVKESINPAALSDRPLSDLTPVELSAILRDNLSKGKLQAFFVESIVGKDVDRKALAAEPIQTLVPGIVFSQAVGAKKFTELTPDDLAALLTDNLDQSQLLRLVNEEVVGRKILQSWPLVTSLFGTTSIRQEVANKAEGIGLSPTLNEKQREEIMTNFSQARLEWHAWLGRDLFTQSMSEVPAEAGIRGAVAGTLWVLLFAIGFSVPLGVGAAVYLEEYATDSRFGRSGIVRWFNRFIETNIRNLAGVPSIIYGLLGLAIFARLLEPVTSGKLFGGGAPNGRTILSAGLTLGILILPVIIINAQEAIRAVPSSIRDASYGLGATKWQTVRRQVLPAAIPGIMTGIILSLSRAIGESAPLIVVGAAVFLSKDPSGPFAPFTTLPIQIYNWAAQPDDQFRNAGSAAIIVLLGLLLLLNAAAIVIRQRFSRRLQ